MRLASLAALAASAGPWAERGAPWVVSRRRARREVEARPLPKRKRREAAAAWAAQRHSWSKPLHRAGLQYRI